jgi:hypothetical protein
LIVGILHSEIPDALTVERAATNEKDTVFAAGFWVKSKARKFGQGQSRNRV